MRLTKAALKRVKRRAKLAMSNSEKFMRFSISPEAVLAMIAAIERKDHER